MINMRISWCLEKNHKFSETQHGFRRNKGCTDNLAILTTEIIKAFEERNTLSALFDIAVPQLKRLDTGFPPRRPRFASRQHVGFVVDEAALGQVFSEYFGFPIGLHPSLYQLKKILFNIKSAYDNVHCSTLLDRLKSVGSSGNLLAFIFNLLSLRELEANYGWLDLKRLDIQRLTAG
jgi:hypothetical protein